MAMQQFLSPNAGTFGRAHSYIWDDPRAQFGQERAMLGLQQEGANYRAELGAQAQRDALAQSQGRFNQLLPMVQGLSSGLVGGQSGPGPQINAGPVWNGQQVQEQVNAAQAKNSASAQTATKGLQQSFAGRGFASNSPLLQALQSGVDMNRMSQNATAAREIPWQAAEGNAKQLLASQRAQEEQFANRQAEDIERRKGNQQYQSSLLSILASMA